MENLTQERRKSKRYRHDMVGGWVRLLTEDPVNDGWHPTIVHNISKGGLCFDMVGKVELADQMQLQTQVDITLGPVVCKGAVVRLRPLENYMTEVGICFTVIADTDSDLVEVFAWSQAQQESPSTT